MRHLSALSFLLLLSAAAFGQVAEWAFSSIPTPVPGISGVSINDSRTAVLRAQTGESYLMQLMQGETLTTIRFPGSLSTSAASINGLGSVVGGYQSGDRTFGFILRNGVYTSFSYPGALDTGLSDINDAGDLIGRYWLANETGYFLYKNGTFTRIVHPNHRSIAYLPSTTAKAINNLGDIVGEFHDGTGEIRLFLLRNGVFNTIGPPGFFSVRDINDAGEVLGDWWDPYLRGSRSAILINGVLIFPAFPDATFTFVNGINNNRDIVGSYSDSTRYHAFVGLNGNRCSQVGIGRGLLGMHSHIDTCQEGFDLLGTTRYTLRDKTRRIDQNPHGHNGQMATDALIETRKWRAFLPDQVMTDEDNNWSLAEQAPGIDAHVNTAKTYDAFLALGINSWDDNGSSMANVVEAPYNADGDPDWSNVSFNPSCNCVYYAPAPSRDLRSFAASLDAAAHEWAHGFTNTHSQLVYSGESGALSEAFSDWLGIGVERKFNIVNWTIAESSYVLGGALRDLSNPPAYGQPDHVSRMLSTTPPCDASNDDCHVHSNSGVPNKMFYLLAETGIHSHEGIKVNGIGLDKALEIAIDANRFRYWPAQATFVDARNGMEMAASRHGPGVVTQVQNAWAAVGVGSPATFKISGYIRRAGTAASGVSVALSGGQSRSVSTSSTGYYEFSGLVANHDYIVTPSSASFDLTPGSRRFDVLSRNEVADFTVTYTVSGQVLKYGQGLPGVSVSLAGGSSANATTNAAGSYAFPGLQPGLSYVVTPSLTGASISPSSFSTGPLTGNVIQNFTVLGPGVGTAGPVLVFRNGFSALETNTLPSRDLRNTAGVFRSDPAIAISTGGNAYIVARDSKEPTLGSVYRIRTANPPAPQGREAAQRAGVS